MRRLLLALAVLFALGTAAALAFASRPGPDRSAEPAEPTARAPRPVPNAAPPPRPAPPRRDPRPAPPPAPSYAVGAPSAGRLVGGVRLPAAGRHFFTWDPIRRARPNRSWRRWGTRRLVATTRRVLAAYAAAHPGAPPVGVGDLSRPRGGDFGPRYGLPGHVSHQNGLDADVYYPRRDGCRCAPDTAAQIDRARSQALVDLWVAAGASHVFVGPGTGLRGPAGVVQVLAHHDNHLHARLAP